MWAVLASLTFLSIPDSFDHWLHVWWIPEVSRMDVLCRCSSVSSRLIQWLTDKPFWHHCLFECMHVCVCVCVYVRARGVWWARNTMLCLYIIFEVSRIHFCWIRTAMSVNYITCKMIAVVIITGTVFLHRQSGFRTGVSGAWRWAAPHDPASQLV